MAFKRRVLFFTLFLVLCFSTAALATPAQDFRQGWQAFHRLVKNKKKAQYRSYWLELKEKFWRVYKQNPKGPYAPKALYYLGRVYEELGKKSYLKSDFYKALDYYQRTINRFPKHSWADDAQFKRANIYLYHLKDTAQAYLELLKVVHNYPKGDMRKKAQKILHELDQANLNKINRRKKNASSSKKITSSSATNKKTEKPKKQYPQSLGRLTNIRHWSSDDYTRIVLDLDEEIKYYYKLLKPDPNLGTSYRLFLDLKKTVLEPHTLRQEKVTDGILRSIRAAQHSQNQARVVLDIQSLDNFRVFSLNNPFRIVVDVYAPGKKTPRKADNITRLHLDPQSKALTSQNLLEQLGLKIKTIMLDAGHGGKDPGAVCKGVREKDINLKMVKILGKLLKKKGFTVLYTRTRDVFIPLEERTAMANSKKVDLFISIHCNAHRNRKIQGLEVYYLNLAKSRDAIRVAARENAVSTKKISDLQFILTDLMLNSKINESRDLAHNTHTCAIKYARKLYSNFKDHGVREAPFYVLMGAKMPAILVELGYITNYQDRRKLTSNSFLNQMAKGLVQGIMAYKGKIERYAKR